MSIIPLDILPQMTSLHSLRHTNHALEMTYVMGNEPSPSIRDAGQQIDERAFLGPSRRVGADLVPSVHDVLAKYVLWNNLRVAQQN